MAEEDVLGTEQQVEVTHHASATVVAARMFLGVVGQPLQVFVLNDGVFHIHPAAQTHLGREPFTHSHVNTHGGAIGEHILETLFTGVVQCHVGTKLNEPVFPETLVFDAVHPHVVAEAPVFVATQVIGHTHIKGEKHVAARACSSGCTGVHRESARNTVVGHVGI